MTAVQASWALTWTWDGTGGDGNWGTGGNWVSGTVPASAATTDLIFAGTNNTGTTLVPLNQNIANPFQLNNLTFASGSGSFFLGGNPLAFTGAARTISQDSSNAQSIANNIIADTNSTVVLTLAGNGAGVVTLSGGISAGNGNRDYAVTKTGTSTFSLTGASDYGGVTTVSAGVLNIQNGSALGAITSGTTVASGAALQIQSGITVGAETLTLNGSGIASDGALRNISGNNTYGGAITLGSASTIASDAGTLTLSGGIVNGGFTFTLAGTGNTTVNSVVSGTGAFVKNSSGAVTLSGVNTFSGGSTLNGGTVIANSASSLGATTGSATINAATLEIAATFTSTRAFTLGNTASTVMVDPTFTFTVNGATGIFSGSGALNKTGTGTLILGGANTYSGATNINAGTLREGTTNVVPDASAVTVASGATYDLNTFSETIGSLAGAGTVTSGAAGALTLTAGGDNTSTSFSGVLQNGSGTFSLTKSGTGTLTLSGANTYSGLTTVSGGILNIQSNGALGTTGGATTVSSGATLQLQSNITVGAEPLTLNGAGVSSFGALRNLSGNNSFAGAITLSSASTIYSDTATLTLSGAIGNGGFAATFAGAGNISQSGVISGSGTLTKSGTGTLTLSGANTYTGITSITGGTLIIQHATALGTTAGSTTVSSGATLQLQSNITVGAEPLTLNGAGVSNFGALRNFSGTNSFGGAITLGSNTTVYSDGGTLTLGGAIVNGGFAATFDGAGNISQSGVISGTGTLSKTGSGTMTLGGNNTYTGATNVSAGILQISASNRIANTSNLTVSGGTFDLQTFSDTVGNVTLSSGSITGTGAATLTGTTFALQSGTASAILAGAGATLTKTTAGTVTLTGANTFTGATTISGGTLTASASSGSALGATSSITVNSGGTLMLGASDQIKNTAPMTLAGGTFAKGNFSEGSAAGPGLGALTLTASGSKIDFGTGTVGVLTFASFSPGSFTLTIDNWTGTVATQGNGTTDRLIFASSQSANLGSFNFTGYAPGAIEFDLLNGYYEVAPAAVPEASTWVAGALALGAVGFHFLRRRRPRGHSPSTT